MRTIYFLLISFCLQATWASPNVHYHREGASLTNALRTGVDTDGKPLYLCVARLFNSMQPGKTWPGYGRCNIPYGGKEYIVEQFEIPPRGLFKATYWQNNGGLAVAVGRDTNGTPLFLCQAFFKGSKQPGKTWPGYNHCNISFAGQEIIIDNYRVLAGEEGRQYHRHANRPHSQHDEYQRHPHSQYHGHPSQQASQQCIHGPFGNVACGFNCVKSVNNIACAPSPDQQCVTDNFGHITCGYGCIKTALKVACARQRGENCAINSFNEIRCGRNCRVDNFNRLQCG